MARTARIIDAVYIDNRQAPADPSDPWPDGTDDDLLTTVRFAVDAFGEATVTLPGRFTIDDPAVEAAVAAALADLDLPAEPVDRTVSERPPTSLEVERAELAGDGVDTVLVAYVDPSPTAPAEVTFTVNGAATPPVPVVDGRAELALSASAPGRVRVQVAGLARTLTAT